MVNFALVFNKDGHPQAFDVTDDFAPDNGKGGKCAKGGKEQQGFPQGCKGMMCGWPMNGGGKAMVQPVGWGMPPGMMMGKGIVGPKGGVVDRGGGGDRGGSGGSK